MAPPGRGFWRALPVFAGVGPAAAAALDGAVRMQDWPAGALIWQRGDPGDSMIALLSGRVKLTLISPAGRELILRQCEPGESFGELALFDGEARSADAVAVEAARGAVLTRAAFRQLAAQHPDLPLAALAYLSGMVRATTDRLETIVLYPLQARLARFFLLALQSLHGTEVPAGARLRLPVTQGELAAMLGASRPKLNRALQALRECGAVADEGGVWVFDPARLAAEAAREV
jgi:CRP-like cAMP-binding protein